MKIERILIRHVHGQTRVCQVRVKKVDYSFNFVDLVTFSEGLEELLMVAERLAPAGAMHPKDREFMQLEGIRVEDASEHNRNLYSKREVAGRRAEGEMICGGDWYMEVSMNGTDTDVSFSTLTGLFVLVQDIIRREQFNHGKATLIAPAEVVARG